MTIIGVKAGRASLPRTEPPEPASNHISRNLAMRSMPECVYYANVGGLIKIGHTGRLHGRMNQLGGDLLALIPHATLDDEAREHAMHTDYLARGREWFHPAPQLYVRINELRAELGLPLIEDE